MTWCEHCRDHFDEGHYTEDGMSHKIGPEFGSTGAEMAVVESAFCVLEGWAASPELGQANLPRLFEALEGLDPTRFRETFDRGVASGR